MCRWVSFLILAHYDILFSTVQSQYYFDFKKLPIKDKKFLKMQIRRCILCYFFWKTVCISLNLIKKIDWDLNFQHSISEVYHFFFFFFHLNNILLLILSNRCFMKRSCSWMDAKQSLQFWQQRRLLCSSAVGTTGVLHYTKQFLLLFFVFSIRRCLNCS